MILALDLVQAVAHHFQKVFVRGYDTTVERKFDDSLRLADGLDLPLGICCQFSKLCHVAPLEDIAIARAALVIGGIDAQSECQRPHPHVRPVRKPRRISDEPALMRRVLMENVRRASDQAFRFHIPYPGRKMLAVLGYESLGRLIHVGDFEVAVDQHKGIGRDISSTSLLSSQLALAPLSRFACGMAVF